MIETPGLQRPGDRHRPLWLSRRTPCPVCHFCDTTGSMAPRWQSPRYADEVCRW